MTVRRIQTTASPLLGYGKDGDSKIFDGLPAWDTAGHSIGTNNVSARP